MQEEAQLIAEAIRAIKSEPNHLKDYAFPIASALFTSILGGLIALLTLKRQEDIQSAKEKISSANKWLLQIHKLNTSLIAIKQNYSGQLNSNPIQRALGIPTIHLNFKPIEENYSDLYFLVPEKDEDDEKVHLEWDQITRIDALVSNYNLLINLWHTRNELTENLKSSLLAKYGDTNSLTISTTGVVRAFGQGNTCRYIDLSERCIKLTDQLISESNDFIEKFPLITKRKINIKVAKNHSKIIKFSNIQNATLEEISKPEVEPDYSSVATLFGEPAEDLKKRHLTGYEHL